MTDDPEPGEFGLIRWIEARAPRHSGVAIGIGDDCAVLDPLPGSRQLVTTDMLMDGRHFQLEEAGPETVGHKALAVNLSDIAAMAGRPVAAFVAVALPRADASAIAQGLLRGMEPLARRFGVALAGGDTNAWDGPLVVCVTLLGESVPPGPVLRSGARPGDRLLVTGRLGGSLLGRHLAPDPRLDEAQALLQAGPIHAMIDLSDGLSSDLRHILDASGHLGAELEAAAIPIHPDAERLSRHDGRSPLRHALDDGEDFELCLAVPPEQARRLLAQPLAGVNLFEVGAVTAEPGLRLHLPDGRRVRVESAGFDHLAPPPHDAPP